MEFTESPQLKASVAKSHLVIEKEGKHSCSSRFPPLCVLWSRALIVWWANIGVLHIKDRHMHNEGTRLK